GQEPIFAAAANDPLQLDGGAVARLMSVIDRTHPRFATVYMPALDVILNRMPLDRTTQLAQSVRALDGIVQTIVSLRRRGYDVLLLGLPGDRQGGRGVLVSTIALARSPASAYDVAPTLCALMGFPASSEMPGIPLVTTDLARIGSYGPRAASRDNVTVNDEYYQNLKSLGYIK
ncbi:MAG TPA: hypothetical protein VJ853_02535, partial [Thermoanaerobaculia bacterium]|nr:hypothetical protein [Thermoanaerobaculia bacterium]